MDLVDPMHRHIYKYKFAGLLVSYIGLCCFLFLVFKFALLVCCLVVHELLKQHSVWNIDYESKLWKATKWDVRNKSAGSKVMIRKPWHSSYKMKVCTRKWMSAWCVGSQRVVFSVVLLVCWGLVLVRVRVFVCCCCRCCCVRCCFFCSLIVCAVLICSSL